MKVHVESVFDCSPELVWEEVQTSRSLLHVTKPWLRFAPLPGAEFPSRWESSGMVRGKAYALSILPLGTHAVHFEKIDHQRRQIQTREYSFFFQQLDHLISVEETAEGKARYSDSIQLHAGWATIFAWFIAWCFFHYRHWRWRGVAWRLAQADAQRKSLEQRRRMFAAEADKADTCKLNSSAITVRATSASQTVLANRH